MRVSGVDSVLSIYTYMCVLGTFFVPGRRGVFEGRGDPSGRLVLDVRGWLSLSSYRLPCTSWSELLLYF
ncbi:hypothetical protein K505DRAFT_135555 [Melanomma pulvis-pyrius CBS 109.77]|uniref:Uncharacterized protein n=1 Tax=Melanomma pulvis-pyrius CBS 109.77 TaxID=1314802 RepID=A0A6A6WSP7_9PLEO|nr:hypothetical protein K505DRAFT_135555 [Melanomma pulvis-pyrius CBS 109.77]